MERVYEDLGWNFFGGEARGGEDSQSSIHEAGGSLLGPTTRGRTTGSGQGKREIFFLTRTTGVMLSRRVPSKQRKSLCQKKRSFCQVPIF